MASPVQSLRDELHGVRPCPWLRRWPLILIVLMVLGVAGNVAIGRKPNYYFDEGRPFTHLSSLQMACIACLSFSICRLRLGSWAAVWSKQIRPEKLWLLAGIGFVFLAIDESAAIHEKLGHVLERASGEDKSPIGQLFDGIIVLVYAVISAVVFWFARREVRLAVHAWRWFALAFALVVVMVAFDMLSEPDVFRALWPGFAKLEVKHITNWLGTVEDFCKLVAVSLFLSGFVRIRWRLLQTAKLESPAPLA